MPLKSASDLFAPVSSSNEISATSTGGFLRTNATRSPPPAVSFVSTVASAAGAETAPGLTLSLSGPPRVTYTAANPMAAAASAVPIKPNREAAGPRLLLSVI